ncbi:TPA: hypothetical protein ACH3X1_016128 [Trebouxia sp. C0004]
MTENRRDVHRDAKAGPEFGPVVYGTTQQALAFTPPASAAASGHAASASGWSPASAVAGGAAKVPAFGTREWAASLGTATPSAPGRQPSASTFGTKGWTFSCESKAPSADSSSTAPASAAEPAAAPSTGFAPAEPFAAPSMMPTKAESAAPPAAAATFFGSGSSGSQSANAFHAAPDGDFKARKPPTPEAAAAQSGVPFTEAFTADGTTAAAAHMAQQPHLVLQVGLLPPGSPRSFGQNRPLAAMVALHQAASTLEHSAWVTMAMLVELQHLEFSNSHLDSPCHEGH